MGRCGTVALVFFDEHPHWGCVMAVRPLGVVGIVGGPDGHTNTSSLYGNR